MPFDLLEQSFQRRQRLNKSRTFGVVSVMYRGKVGNDFAFPIADGEPIICAVRERAVNLRVRNCRNQIADAHIQPKVARQKSLVMSLAFKNQPLRFLNRIKNRAAQRYRRAVFDVDKVHDFMRKGRRRVVIFPSGMIRIVNDFARINVVIRRDFRRAVDGDVFVRRVKLQKSVQFGRIVGFLERSRKCLDFGHGQIRLDFPIHDNTPAPRVKRRQLNTVERSAIEAAGQSVGMIRALRANLFPICRNAKFFRCKTGRLHFFGRKRHILAR